MPSKEFANQVLNALEQKGNSPDEINAKLDSLDANQQVEFINQAATKLGMSEDKLQSEAPQESTAKRVVREGFARMDQPATIDQSQSDALTMGAADLAGLVRPLAPVTSLVEKGIAHASRATGLGDQEIAQRVIDQPSEELTADTRRMMDQADAEHPILTAAARAIPTAGVGLVPSAITTGVASYLNSPGDIPEKLVRGTEAGMGAFVGSKAIEAVAGAAGSALKSAGSGLKSLARKLSTKSVNLKSAGGMGENDLAALGDELIKQNVTATPGTAAAVKDRLDKAINSAGGKIDRVYSIIENSAGPEAMPNREQILRGVQQYAAKDAMTASFPGQVVKEMQDLVNAQKRGPESVIFTPRQILDLAQDAETEAQRFTSEIKNPELENRRTALVAGAKALRDYLKQLVKTYAPEESPSFQDSLKTYSLLKKADSAMQISGKKSYLSQGTPGFNLDQAMKTVSAPFTESVGKTSGVAAADWASRAAAYAGQGADVLKQAASRGQAALNATAYVLSQTNEDFRKHMRGEADDTK